MNEISVSDSWRFMQHGCGSLLLTQSKRLAVKKERTQVCPTTSDNFTVYCSVKQLI
ncbi:hypothetical protein AGR8A_Cc60380 [Agrobacterium fabrum str. J-07]|nr:hypothetical protein AGR8A_Cc60380 [Agrobacterium fabrum str. J-07]